MRRARRYLPAALAAALALALPNAPARAFQCHVGTITFHASGGVKECELEGTHELTTAKDARIVCKSGERAALHPGGALAGCTLAAPYRVGPQSCPAGARVTLHPDGAISACE